MKANLENMAQQSAQSQKLYNERLGQIAAIKDPQRQQQAMNNLKQAAVLPLSQRLDALNNVIPAEKYSNKDFANAYPLTDTQLNPRNKQAITTLTDFAIQQQQGAPYARYQEQIDKGVTPEQARQNVIDQAVFMKLKKTPSSFEKAY